MSEAIKINDDLMIEVRNHLISALRQYYLVYDAARLDRDTIETDIIDCVSVASDDKLELSR